MTDEDLKFYVKQLAIKHFRGVYMNDTLPKKIKRIECGIVNLDSNKNSGTHWTAYFKKNSQITYFDSYGNLVPTRQLHKYFNSDGRQNSIRYNYDTIQKWNSYRCGQYCLIFLYNMMNER